MTPEYTDLTEAERNTLTHALRIAAERFNEHETNLKATPEQKPAYAGLAAQFARQTAEALALAERLDNAEFIRVGKPCLDAEDLDEPEHDDSVKCCPDCEKPNQFGELCAECAREFETTTRCSWCEKPAINCECSSSKAEK
jgi:hypothetical protein